MRRYFALTRTPGRRRPPLFQELVFHAGLPELCLQTFDLGVLFRGHGISAEVGVFLPPSCDPVPDCLRHKTVRSGHPGHRPGPPDDPENDPPLKPRTASRHRHDPTPPRSLSPTARKTPNTPNHLPGSALGLRNPTHHSAKNLFEAGRLRPQPHPRCEEPSIEAYAKPWHKQLKHLVSGTMEWSFA